MPHTPDPAGKTAPRPRRRQADRRASSDSRLLAAANGLVAEEGMEAATFQKIAARAGYSSGLVAQRFGSKLGLIEGQVAEAQASFQARIAKMQRPGTSGLEAVLAYVPDFLESLHSDPTLRAYFVLLADAVGNYAPTLRLFAASHRQFEAVIEGLLRRGQAEGEVRQDIDPALQARLIGNTTFGITLQSFVDPETDLKPIASHYVQSLRTQLATPAASEKA